MLNINNGNIYIKYDKWLSLNKRGIILRKFIVFCKYLYLNNKYDENFVFYYMECYIILFKWNWMKVNKVLY